MPTRLEREIAWMKEYFPSFRYQDSSAGSQAGFIGKHRVNGGKEYTLWIELGSFPHASPRMYVVQPSPLLDHAGTPLSGYGVRASMHLLHPNKHGHPQICHYNDRCWHPDITIYKIAFKGRLWIEAFEGHLRNGCDIDVWLGHMAPAP